MRELIVERSIGLGQIAALLGVRTNFELDEVARRRRTCSGATTACGATASSTASPRRSRPGPVPGGRTEPARPFPFFVGCGRSGTTLLRAMVDAHPDMAVPPESHFVGRGAAAGRGLRLGELRRPPVRPATGSRCGSLDRARVAADRGDGPRRLPRRGAGRLRGCAADRAGKPRYGRQDARLRAARAAARRACSPRRSSCTWSATAATWPPRSSSSGWAALDRGGRPALGGCGSAGAGGRAGSWPAGRYHELRYEDLVADPEAALRAVCAGDRPDVRRRPCSTTGPGGRGGPARPATRATTATWPSRCTPACGTGATT